MLHAVVKKHVKKIELLYKLKIFFPNFIINNNYNFFNFDEFTWNFIKLKTSMFSYFMLVYNFSSYYLNSNYFLI